MTGARLTQAESRAKVVAIAREWIGTPYRHQARLKGIAADCTFIATVYVEAGVIEAFDIPPYNPTAHLHREGGRYLATALRFAHETQTPMPGDAAIYKIGRDYSHGAIIVEPGWPNVIHADLAAGFVIEAFGDQANLAVASDRKFLTMW